MSVFDNDPAERGASFYEALPPRPDTSDHSEVAAALARFQAKLACANYVRRAKVSSVWAACAVLTVAAFAGGLSLARFSFNSPENPVAILTRAPELIYLPPQSPASAFADLQSALRAVPVIGADNRQEARRGEPWADASDAPSSIASQDHRALDGLAVSESGDLDLHELGRSWAEAVRVANAMQWSNNAHQPEPLQHGYAAVEVSAIPEASTGLAVAVAVASILVFGHSAKRWKRSSLRVAHQDLV